MAYDQTDLDNVETAIMAVAKGERIGQVSIGGKFIRYNEAQNGWEMLHRLRDIIRRDLGLIASRAFAKPKGRF